MIERPHRGSRMMKDCLEDRGIRVGRERIRRLMRLMGLVAIYPKKRTSIPDIAHEIYPYLLGHIGAFHANMSIRESVYPSSVPLHTFCLRYRLFCLEKTNAELSSSNAVVLSVR